MPFGSRSWRFTEPSAQERPVPLPNLRKTAMTFARRATRRTMAALDRRPASKLSTVLTATSAALGAAALVNYLVAKRTESRNPPTGKFITVDGVRLHYIERGIGMPVVFLHGSGTSADDYDVSGVLDLVAKNHRVIAFDRPGFGHSERPRSTIWTVEAQARLLHKSLGQLDVGRPILVGHSWGTLVALKMALDNPLDTAGLVLLSGYYFPSARADVALAPWPAVPVTWRHHALHRVAARGLADGFCRLPKALRAVRRDNKVHGAFPIRDDAPPISDPRERGRHRFDDAWGCEPARPTRRTESAGSHHGR
jgi:pimeloyl-ACP methyl ester carboxylesterase